MYVIGVSHVFGLEAWNSYLTNYPRDLKLIATLNVTAILTNQSRAANVVLSNRLMQATTINIPALFLEWVELDGIRAMACLLWLFLRAARRAFIAQN